MRQDVSSTLIGVLCGPSFGADDDEWAYDDDARTCACLGESIVSQPNYFNYSNQLRGESGFVECVMSFAVRISARILDLRGGFCGALRQIQLRRNLKSCVRPPLYVLPAKHPGLDEVGIGGSGA